VSVAAMTETVSLMALSNCRRHKSGAFGKKQQ
jgi:hypothetical protein